MVIEKIENAIKNKQNFLLSGGAGSGKTYALMQTLEIIFKSNEKSKVACITYTNIATKEIINRSPYPNLIASTIHDFLWSQIKSFQKNIKSSLLTLIAEEKINTRSEVEINEEYLKERQIKYRDYKKLEEGIISHSEVIKIAEHLFKNYPLLNDIIKDKFDFILIDEYQDTQKEVINIFLEHLSSSSKDCILGFFGDSMQSIYNGRTGNLNTYIESGIIEEILKEDNYRCSLCVIKLLNKLRSDIIQKPAKDNVSGSCKFIYSAEDTSEMSTIKSHPVFSDWDFADPLETKELYLTHKLIAKQKGFKELLNSRLSNDEIAGDSPSIIIRHLLKIAELTFLYKQKEYNAFINKTGFTISTHSDKEKLKENIETLLSRDISLEEAIEKAHELKLVLKDDRILNYIDTQTEKYESIKSISLTEILNLFEYRENLSLYSTQHGVKGAEFSNVFLILDNGRWNMYSFKHLFEKTEDRESVIERTNRIFYVSCSRAKENLIVYYHKPSNKVLEQAKLWFEEENVININE